MEWLLEIDQHLLLAINGWHAPWADSLMWIVSRSATWIPLYVVMASMIVWRSYSMHTSIRWTWVRIVGTIALIGLAVGLADIISSGIIKPLVCRPRPTHDPQIENLLHIVNGYRGGIYGFVSSHAANTAALTLLFSLIWRRWNYCSTRPTTSSIQWMGRYAVPIVLAIYCAINCYSRMYLGVHYPADIVGGLLIGLLVAGVVYLPWHYYVADVGR